MTRYVMMTIVLVLASTSAFAQDDRPFEVAGGYLSVGSTMHGWSCRPICNSPFRALARYGQSKRTGWRY